MTRKTRRGISPVIATVIIVAVAIAIAIAVAGWLFGIWGGLTTSQPQIKITPLNAKYDDANNRITVKLYITNTGNTADKILSAVAILPNGTSVEAASFTPTTVDANSETSVTLIFNGITTGVATGDTVTVEVVFAETGKHSTLLTITT